MLRDITIGQYYQAKSVIHSLDPRVKLFGTLVFILALFISDNVIGYAIATIFFLTVVYLSKVPIKFMMKGLKAIVVIIAFSAVFTMFATDGHVLAKIWIFKITAEGVIKAVQIVYRLVILIMSASVMTLTTTPTDIADGMEKSFSPLNKIKVPVHEIAMMVSIAFRFIPILTEETDKIMKAQMARGADFESGGFIKKAKAMIPLIVPLLVSSVRRALDLATAMEARCYKGGEGRTKMKPLVYKNRDRIAYGILVAYFAVMVGMNYVWKVII